MSARAAIWDAVHQERRRLVQDLEGIGDEQWRASSLCPGWSVHDMLAHLIDSATTTGLGFLRQMVSSRFEFDRANAAGVERHRSSDPLETLAAFRAVSDRTDSPPASLATRLVEAYVHGEDIRRPWGWRRTTRPSTWSVRCRTWRAPARVLVGEGNASADCG